jgi:hypothetical protein
MKWSFSAGTRFDRLAVLGLVRKYPVDDEQRFLVSATQTVQIALER